MKKIRDYNCLFVFCNTNRKHILNRNSSFCPLFFLFVFVLYNFPKIDKVQGTFGFKAKTLCYVNIFDLTKVEEKKIKLGGGGGEASLFLLLKM